MPDDDAFSHLSARFRLQDVREEQFAFCGKKVLAGFHDPETYGKRILSSERSGLYVSGRFVIFNNAEFIDLLNSAIY